MNINTLTIYTTYLYVIYNVTYILLISPVRVYIVQAIIRIINKIKCLVINNGRMRVASH